MIAQPEGWLRSAARIARGHGALLIADEVIDRVRSNRPDLCLSKRIRRAGPDGPGKRDERRLFAHGRNSGDRPDLQRFPRPYDELKTFFHGHSYTGNQLGAAASLASLELLESARSIRARATLEKALSDALRSLWKLPNVGDIRQVGLMAGVELVKNWKTREPFPLQTRAGQRVCEAMARRGVLTRPVGNVIVSDAAFLHNARTSPPHGGVTAPKRGEIFGSRSSSDHLG